MRTEYKKIKKSIYKYRHSQKGLIAHIFNNQKTNSKNRKGKSPKYNLNSLRKWVFSQKNFVDLYDDWKKSNYDKYKMPSVDRINPILGYKLNNLQLMNWKENLDKGRREMTITQGKPVAQYNKEGKLLNIYLSIVQAGKESGIDYRHIGNCVKKSYGNKTAGGFVWKYKFLSKSQLADIWNKANKLIK